MSIQSVTTNPYAYASQYAGSSTPVQALQALGSALNTGNLTAAQADFSQLVSSSGNAGTNTILNGGSGGGSQLAVDPIWNGGINSTNVISAGGNNSTNVVSAGGNNSTNVISAGGNNSTNVISAGSASATANPIQTDMNALGSALQLGNTAAAQTAYGQLQQDIQKMGGHHHHHHGGGGQPSSSDSTTASTAAATSGAATPATSASQVSPAVSALAALAQAASPSLGGTSVNSLLSMFA